MKYLLLERGERDALRASMMAMPEFLAERFGALTAAEAAEPGPDGLFAPVEQCWHLADLEREGYGARIGRLLAEDAPALPDFDGARLARERAYRTLSLAEGLRAFAAARRANLAALDALSDAQWSRPGTQEGVGPVMLCDVPAMMAEHDAAHRDEIEAWTRARTMQDLGGSGAKPRERR
jgi:hypothetical protein